MIIDRPDCASLQLEVSNDGAIALLNCQASESLGRALLIDTKTRRDIKTKEGVAVGRLVNDEAVLVSGAGWAEVWGARTGAVRNRVVSGNVQLAEPRFDAAASRFITFGLDDRVSIWSFKPHERKIAIQNHSARVSFLTFLGDQHLVTNDWKGEAFIWNKKTGERVLKIDAPVFRTFACGPPDTFAIIGEGSAMVVKLEGGNLHTTAQFFDIGFDQKSAACSADGRYSAAVRSDLSVAAWDIRSEREVFAAAGEDEKYTAVHFVTGNAPLLAAAGSDGFRGKVVLYDLTTGRARWTEKFDEVADHFAGGGSLGRLFVRTNRTVGVIDVASGELLSTLDGHEDSIGDMKMSRDQKWLVTVNPIVKVWDTSTLKNVATMVGHNDFITNAAFSADGLRLLTSAGDNTVALWDVATAQVLARFPGQQARWTASFGEEVAFDDGDRVAWVSTAERGVVAWDVSDFTQPLGSLKQAVCRDLLRDQDRSQARHEAEADPLIGRLWPADYEGPRDVCTARP